MSLQRVWIPCGNYSSRSGSVRLLIVHTAEGARNYTDLGVFFQSTEGGPNPVSSQVGIDDTPGVIGEYVKPDYASWCAGGVNSIADQVELCAFAAWSRDEWLRHPVMLDNLQAWLAEESARFGIPLVKSSEHGVCGHVDVSGPGGHYDPGPAFPWDVVLSGSGPVSIPDLEEEPDMIILRAPSGSCSTFDGTRKHGIPNASDLAALQAAGVKLANVSLDFYNGVPNA